MSRLVKPADPAAVRQRLVSWFAVEGITWDQQALDIECKHACCGTTAVASLTRRPTQLCGDGHAYALRILATQDVAVDRVVTTIPKTAVLSIKNTGIANLIEEAGLGGSLGLALAVMYEIENGVASPWYGYLQSLPTHEDVPIFWSEAELALLEGTELESYVAEYRAALDEDFDEHVAPLVAANPDYFPPNEESTRRRRFFEASSLVSSRAFEVDDYHGTAMVPFADLYNHRTAAENVHIEAEGDVCPFCGSAVGCACMDDDDESTDGHCGHDHDDGHACNHDHGPPVMEQKRTPPPITETREELSKRSVKELKGILKERGIDFSGCFEKADLVTRILERCVAPPDEEEECPELADERTMIPKGLLDSEDDGEEVEDALEMRVVRAFHAGEEVFNTYGDHTNASLLSRYGFVEENNVHDVVCIQRDALVALLLDQLGEKRLEDRLAYWDETGRALTSQAVEAAEKAAEANKAAEEDEGDDEQDATEDGDDGEANDDDGWDSVDEDEDGDEEAGDVDDADEEDDEGEDDDESSEDGPAADDLKFHLDHGGRASPHLLVFLHLAHADVRAFRALTRDPAVARRHVRHLVAARGGEWLTEQQQPAATVAGSAASGPAAAVTTVNAVPSPLARAVCATLVRAAESRAARLAGGGGGGDGSEGVLESEPAVKAAARTLRREELAVLARAAELYRAPPASSSPRRRR
ncbi:hypothetical protein HK405_003682 [Cladochytrium tenue]|nr:hypothetical protein HK405_003682 [Cladochytrium tenue]